MRNNDPRWMSIGELWELNKDVMFEYAQKLWSDELELEERLRHLQGADNISGPPGTGVLTLDIPSVD